MTSPCLDLEIGLTIATLASLRDKGLPDPDEWTFVPYSRVEVGGDGRPRGFGFPTASWTWSVLSQDQLNGLLELFASDSDASVSLVIWTYTDSGHGLGAMRARYQAILSRPTDGSGKTMYAQSRSPIYTDVTTQFSHLVSV